MNKKVTAQEIIEAIQEKENITKKELAEIFSVCVGTVEKRLKELRADGEGLFHNENGLYFMDSIVSKEDQAEFEKYLKWLLGAFKGLATCGKVTKPLLLESKKYLREQLTRKERQALTNYTAQVNRILSNIMLEQEMEEE